MEFNELSDELKSKARECTSADELVQLAESEGIELTDDELEMVSGGKAPWEACVYHNCSENCGGD